MDYEMSMLIDTSSMDLNDEATLQTLSRAIRKALAKLCGVSVEQIVSLELSFSSSNGGDRRRLNSEKKEEAITLQFEIQYDEEDSALNGTHSITTDFEQNNSTEFMNEIKTSIVLDPDAEPELTIDTLRIMNGVASIGAKDLHKISEDTARMLFEVMTESNFPDGT